MLFYGTLRYNLDPFNEFDDDIMFSALLDVEDKEALTKGKGWFISLYS